MKVSKQILVNYQSGPGGNWIVLFFVALTLFLAYFVIVFALFDSPSSPTSANVDKSPPITGFSSSGIQSASLRE